MKRLFLLALAFLAACSSADIAPSSYFDSLPDTVILRLDSSSEQIQQAMLQSATHWTTLQLSGSVAWYGADGSTQVFEERAWIDPANSRFKVELNGAVNAADKIVRFSDGETVHNLNLNSGLAETSPYPDFARVGQFVPPVGGDAAYPHPMWGQMGTPLSEMAFSANFAQSGGTFSALSLESVAGRETLVVEWTPASQTRAAYKFWLDTRTAVILKMQEFGVKEGTGALRGERIVDNVSYNQIFDASVFSMPSDFEPAAMPTQVASQPIETGPTAADGAGELYFFLMPHQSGAAIRLAKVSGFCVFDPANCPPMQIVNAPFPFNFAINPLAWSPDGQYAAFAYSDYSDGTPTKLWLFDPVSDAWTSLAEFPYIDPPFWSSDGEWIAFRTQDGYGGEDVYVIRRDGSGLRSVSAGLPIEGKPYIMDGWLGGSVIMRSALPGAGNTYASYFVNAADGSARPAFEGGANKSQFIAAPDKSLLALDDYDELSQTHVLKAIDVSGANETVLATFKGGSVYPVVWSPNSQWIAFNYYSDLSNGMPSAEVYIVRRDGQAISSLYKGVTVGRLIFSPNGKYLLVEETSSPSGGHLFLINLSTLETKMLQAPGLTADFDWYAPSWRP
ncbi:MAG: hypothetical protein LDL50_02670 [Chloroflexi bacterium]|nr:hypothetical protein [Chloroflexota bacterium]MCA2003078.1 hypothetical protein [Chloroflexota bacterium]